MLFSIICIVITSILVISVISEEISFKKFKDRLMTGTVLTNRMTLIDDEFDEGHTFRITVIKKGNRQVKVRYDDGSESVMDIYMLFDEGWTIIR